MASPNGTAHAAADDPLNLGSLVPEMKQVRLIRDGQQVILEAFSYATSPVSVYALIAQAHDAYMVVREDQTARVLHHDQALCDYYRAVAKALIIGLTYEEADNLGGDFVKLKRLLGALGFPPPRPETDMGEVAGEAVSTMASLSPDSEPSTAATTVTG